MNPITDSPLFSRPSHLISRAGRLLVRVADTRLRPLGLSSGQLPVLAALAGGQVLAQKELARLARIEQPTMAQTLARMERDGLTQRRPDPADKRSSLISLCPAAEEKMGQVVDVLLGGNEEALQGLDHAEREVLADLLRRVIANLETMAGRRE